MNWGLFANSLALAGVATAVAVAAGSAVGLATATAGSVVRRWMQAIVIVALALPAFLVAGVWMEHVGFAGAWRVSLGGAGERVLPLGISAVVLASLLWPITTLLLSGAWSGLDAALLEGEPMLRGRAVLRHVLWPRAAPALGQAALMTFLLALNNFAVPTLFQARVWPTDVWLEYSTRFDTRAALWNCWPILVLSLVVLLSIARRPVAWRAAPRPTPGELLARRLGAPWAGGIHAASALVIAISVAFPLAAIFLGPQTWTELLPAIRAAGPAVGWSLLYAGSTATLVMALGIAWHAHRWPALLALSFVLPGVFVGIGLIHLFNRPGWEAFYGSAGLVILAFLIRYGFVGWAVAGRIWTASDPRLRDTARSEGAGFWGVWRHAVLPQASHALFGAWYAVFVLSLWDVETMILIVPPGGESLGMRIFNLLHYGHNAHVNALCIVLLALALAPLALASAWQFFMARSPRGVHQ